MDQSFPSLVDDEALTEDSFWPSFTDILTVIVMIFLMAMLVLLLRNMELISQLQDTMKQKEQVFRQSEQVKQQNISLAARLQQAEAHLHGLREKQQQLTARLDVEVAQQEKLSAHIQAQQARLEQLQQQNSEQESQLQAKDLTIAEQQAYQQRLEGRYALASQSLVEATAKAAANQVQWERAAQHSQELEQHISALKDEQTRQQALMRKELQQWRVQAERNSRDLVQVQDEYSALHARYIRLLRPARSPRNKHVVEVLYDDRDGVRVYGMRDSSNQPWREMAQRTLEEQLAVMKQQYGAQLYVRIIIPDNSPISFNEAWDFTHRMLKRYDYYYQKQR
jgi:myosin heavy subunit